MNQDLETSDIGRQLPHGWWIAPGVLLGVVLIICSLLWWGHAKADVTCPQNATCLSWTQPTQNTDGTPIDPITANTVYRGTRPDGSDLSLLQSIPAATSYTDANLTQGTWYYALTATTTLGESDKTSLVSKTILAKPNPPASLTVSANLTAYRLVQNLDKLAMVEVGAVKAGTACDNTQFINVGDTTYYRIPRAQVTWSGNWKPATVFGLCS